MASNFKQLAYYIILLIFCTDQGDGHWKKKDFKAIQRYLESFRKIADKLEHEMKTFSEDYDATNDELFTQNASNLIRKPERLEHENKTFNEEKTDDELVTHNVTNLERKDETNDLPSHRNELTPKPVLSTNDVTTEQGLSDEAKPHQATPLETPKNLTKKLDPSLYKWPKFEDILLAMGKKYDWKNDRWIKVKDKVNNKYNNKTKITLVDKISPHVLHNFSYRTVKLGIKGRKHIVIAVTAVR